MNPRFASLFARLLGGIVLASPAWSQEPSFDLASDSVKQILRNTAASQSVPVRKADAAAVNVAEASAEVPAYVGPAKPPAPQRARPAPVEPPDTFVSALFEILFDEVLDIDEPEIEYDASRAKSLSCQPQKALDPTPELPASCPGVP